MVILLLALPFVVGQSAPLPSCENALPPGEGFGGAVTITTDCIWRPQLHFISSLQGQQRDYPGPLEAPVIYYEAAAASNSQSGAWCSRTASCTARLHVCHEQLPLTAAGTHAPAPAQALLPLYGSDRSCIPLTHYSLSFAYAGPGRLMLSNVVLANFTLSSPSMKGAAVLWPQGMLQPGVQPGTTALRKLYMHDVKIIVSAQSLQENIRFFQNTTVQVYTVSACAALAAHGLGFVLPQG